MNYERVTIYNSLARGCIEFLNFLLKQKDTSDQLCYIIHQSAPGAHNELMISIVNMHAQRREFPSLRVHHH